MYRLLHPGVTGPAIPSKLNRCLQHEAIIYSKSEERGRDRRAVSKYLSLGVLRVSWDIRCWPCVGVGGDRIEISIKEEDCDSPAELSVHCNNRKKRMT